MGSAFRAIGQSSDADRDGDCKLTRLSAPGAEAEKAISLSGKLDAGTLKLKVAAYIVAISAIQLLQAYMNIEQVPNDKLLWMTIIHLTFVVSALLLTVMDRMMGIGQKQV